MRSLLLLGAPPIALSSSPSSAFSPHRVFLLSTVMHFQPSRMLLLAPPRHSLQLFMSRLHSSWDACIIGSSPLALPLHHLLTGLSHFQCPAHRAVHRNRSSRPCHESFMNQCLFSALIGVCWVQTSASRGSSIIRLQQRIGPANWLLSCWPAEFLGYLRTLFS